MNSSNSGNITVNASGEARWVIYFWGYPMPDRFSWKNKKGDELTGERFKYETKINLNKNHVVLTIHEVSMQDGGRYTFTLENKDLEKSMDLFLTVRGTFVISERSIIFLLLSFQFPLFHDLFSRRSRSPNSEETQLNLLQPPQEV